VYGQVWESIIKKLHFAVMEKACGKLGCELSEELLRMLALLACKRLWAGFVVAGHLRLSPKLLSVRGSPLSAILVV